MSSARVHDSASTWPLVSLFRPVSGRQMRGYYSICSNEMAGMGLGFEIGPAKGVLGVWDWGRA
jgi:hypothetical protein